MIEFTVWCDGREWPGQRSLEVPNKGDVVYLPRVAGSFVVKHRIIDLEFQSIRVVVTPSVVDAHF